MQHKSLETTRMYVNLANDLREEVADLIRPQIDEKKPCWVGIGWERGFFLAASTHKKSPNSL